MASGTFDSGSVPTTGAGTRMMWYPAKAAFRAGRVGLNSVKGDVWDPDSVGNFSVAFGADTKASGEAAMAMGFETSAAGSRALAMGERAAAGGLWAVAMGRGTVANTNRSVSVGECNSASSSPDNALFVVGNGTFDSSTGSCTRSDAFVVDESGSATASSHDTFSDRRLKTNVEPLGEGVLEAVQEIDPVRYRFKNESTGASGVQIGLLAQDVQEEFPELVREGSEGYLSLAYPKITAVLLKGIREQQAQIKEQRGQIEAQQKQIKALKAENEEIRSCLVD